MGKTKRRVLERPPLTLIRSPRAPPQATDRMLARETRQVVPTVRRFPPRYAAAWLATLDPSGAGTIRTHGSSQRLRWFLPSSRVRQPRAFRQGDPLALPAAC